MGFKEEVAKEFRAIQDEICAGLEAIDGSGTFKEDKWNRPGGGGGASRVLQHGKLFEKGGVNFSEVYGELPELVQKEFKTNSKEFFATGVSIVIHPNNPHVPILHMNIRYFELPGENKYWFGGGIDLTPHYIKDEEAKAFHQVLKDSCDKYNPEYYPEFKTWADNYFYIPHREETRGIGGIFFDHQKENESRTKEELRDFVFEVGRSFLPAYLPQVKANMDKSFTEQEKQWQLLRRGRYVEFNLVYDRGTSFGLKTGGRIESILMSLPYLASWEYDVKVQKNSPEEKTLGLLKKGINWV